MRRAIFGALAVLLAAEIAAAGELPVRGLHVSAPYPEDMALAERFIKETLPREGVNTLVVSFGYRVQYRSRPEVTDENALSLDEVRQLASWCREAGIRLIPEINLLGHQSWRERTHGLLRAHPEFDETPGKYPNNEGIYCRSYCPRHPEVHEVVFDLIDELLHATEADAFHAGMDEVFILGDPDCPRCKGEDPAVLFAEEVRRIHAHLAKRGVEMWMWSDRFLDGAATGIGKWQASLNGTHPAIRDVPRDIVMCDWHYRRAEPTAAYFAAHGFPVVSSPWRDVSVALGQLELIRLARQHASPELAANFRGVLQTTWVPFRSFVEAYEGKTSAGINALQAAECFRELFSALRSAGLVPPAAGPPATAPQ